MVNKAYAHNEYKIIKSVVLNKFKSNLLDTLDRYDNTLLILKNDAAASNQTADSTLKVLQETQQNLDNAVQLKNSFSFSVFIFKKYFTIPLCGALYSVLELCC